MQEQPNWLTDRAMLMGEISGRVRALRVAVDRRGVAHGFRAGLVVFLERRLDHLEEVMIRVQTAPESDSARRQSLDRMLAAVVGTLRHVELEMSVDTGPDPEWKPIPAPDRRLASARRADSGSMAQRAVAHYDRR